MKRLLTLGIAIALVSLVLAPAMATASDQPVQGITHGEFAQLLLERMTRKGDLALSPAQALVKLQEMEFLPATWGPDSIMTHGDLATVANIFGVSYVPPAEDAPVTRGFAISFLRRYRQRIEARRAGAVMHGFSESLAMDPGVDRAVSPGDFPR